MHYRTRSVWCVIASLLLLGCLACNEPIAPAIEVEENLLFLSTRAGVTDLHGRPMRDIYRVSIEGVAPVNLTQQPSFVYSHVSVADDGRRVAFSSDRDGCDIWIMNSDGIDLHRATGPGEGCNAWPRWSRDGTQLAFASNRDDRQIDQTGGLYDAYVMDSGSGQVRNVTAAFAGQLDHALEVVGWSPSGEIVLETYGVEEGEISRRTYLVSTDGGSMRPFLEPGDHSASWSPDGTMVVFIRERDGGRHLYIGNHDGTAVRPLTDSPEDDRLPNGCCGLSDVRFDISPWSPDGRRIAFERMGGVAYGSIYVINVDGTGLQQLTSFSASFNGWSPSGHRIALTRRTPPDPTDVYVMDSDGANLRNVTNDVADDGDAVWVR